MKTTAFHLLTAAIVLVFSSCDIWEHRVIPTSRVTSMDFTITDYETISASHAFKVYLTFSDTEESIEIEANENLHQYIEVKKENNTLSIGIRNDIHVTGSPTLKAHITTKHVSNFYGSGASKFQLTDAVESANASIRLSGASTFSGALDVSELYAELSGASSANLSGFARETEAEASGASSIRDYDFSTKILKADLSGASSAHLYVEDQIDVIASGASSLHYKGDAVIVNQDISGSSKISKEY
jgi:hypothetical protein